MRREEGFLLSSRGGSLRVRTAAAFVGAVVLLSLLIAASGRTAAHTGAWIDSTWTTAPPTIDGAMNAGEWSDAQTVDLSVIPGNGLPAWLLAKNDANFLYLAYDAVGDTTPDAMDAASVGFDTDHDLVLTAGREDEFFWGGLAMNGEEHWVSDGFSWYTEDSPFNTGLPNHAGLASAYGFGPSDLSAGNHRIFELQIPLVLLGAAPGSVVGFLGASYPSPGVLDFSTFAYSTWPDYLLGPPALDGYGDLRLGQASQVNDLDLNPPSQSKKAAPLSSALYGNLTVINRGTATDTFDLTVSSAWTATLLDSSGVNPLTDTDGDTIPDTGPLPAGGGVVITVRIDVPATTGCDDALVVGTSSNDVGVSDTAILHTCVPVAFLAPPHSDQGIDTDTPPNGLFDVLEVDVSVTVNVDDMYIAIVYLFDQTQTSFITAQFEFGYLPAGSRVIPVPLSGTDIYRSGIDGPYVAMIELYDFNFVLLDTGSHTTAAYLAADFDPPPATFNPPHTDVGEDTDVPPNGRYDLLVVNVGVSVVEAGSFTIFGTLYDPSFNYVTSASAQAALPVGNHVVRLAFVGRDIFTAGFDGPYMVILNLYDSGFNLLDSDFHVTAPYLATDFDPPPASFLPPHSDRGVDLDVPPDGLFEFLEIDASVSVAEAGRFIAVAALWDTSYTFFISQAAATVDLGLGLQSVPIRFDGIDIRNAGFDGPYAVDLYLADDLGFLDYDFYLTGPYLATGFSGPGAAFLPPHTDYLIDTDSPPDGLADALLLDVGVDVFRLGTYTVEGLLTDPMGRYLDAALPCSVMAVGPGMCTLAFDGHAIARAGVDGPYLASIQLFDAYGRLLDTDSVFTASYLADDFEPPDGTAPTATAGAVPYWKNRAPLDVPYTASDPTPTDGLASVTLRYRFSSDNASWGAWTAFQTLAVSGSTASGSFPFTFPAGPGFYEFQVTARDVFGNEEALGTAEARAAFRPVVGLDVAPATIPLTAGQQTTLTITVLGPGGQPAVLESALTVLLTTFSPSGEFRQVGTTGAIAAIVIPPGQSGIDVDYYDTAAGTWTLRVSSAGTADGWVAVDVSAGPPVSAEVNPLTASLEVGGSQLFTASAWDDYGNPVAASFQWTADPAVGTISPGGFLTAATTVASGTVTASVVGAPTVQATASVSLRAGPPSQVSVDPPSANVAVDGTLGFSAIVRDQYGNEITAVTLTWSVAGGIGSVDESGTFTAGRIASSGSVVATSGGVQGISAVTVQPGPTARVVVSPPSAVLPVGSTASFTAEVQDAYGNTISGASITWSVTGTIGTVDGTGAFTAGTAVATGTVVAASGGLQGSAAVTLVPGPPAEIRISPDGATSPWGTDVGLRAGVWDAYGNPISSASVAWTADGPGSLSTSSGPETRLTGTAQGTVTVTATSGSLSASATFAFVDPPMSVGTLGGLGIGALAAGLAVGFLVGRLSKRRRKGPETPAPPDEVAQESPPEPPAT